MTCMCYLLSVPHSSPSFSDVDFNAPDASILVSFLCSFSSNSKSTFKTTTTWVSTSPNPHRGSIRFAPHRRASACATAARCSWNEERMDENASTTRASTLIGWVQVAVSQASGKILGNGREGTWTRWAGCLKTIFIARWESRCLGGGA